MKKKPPARKKQPPARKPKSDWVRPLKARDLDKLRKELEHAAASSPAARWNADPEDVRRSVAKLVLTLVDFLRRLMERQAIRRMEAKTLSATEIEQIGLALMKLEETLRDIAGKFGLTPEELNLDLGPLGRLH